MVVVAYPQNTGTYIHNVYTLLLEHLMGDRSSVEALVTKGRAFCAEYMCYEVVNFGKCW